MTRRVRCRCDWAALCNRLKGDRVIERLRELSAAMMMRK